MTEHKRPRFMAAAGVSTVFLTVIAGVAGKTPFSHAANATPAASVVPAATNPILLRLSQLEKRVSRIAGRLTSLQGNLQQNYTNDHDLQAFYLQTTAARQMFLASNGTAANSDKLGDLAPNSFVQGNATVVSGNVTVGPDEKTGALLQSATGALAFKVVYQNASFLWLYVTNNTSGTLPAVVDFPPGDVAGTGGTAGVLLGPGTPVTNEITLGAPDSEQQISMQIFPSGAFSNTGGSFDNIVTLTVSAFAQSATSNVQIVGQLVESTP